MKSGKREKRFVFCRKPIHCASVKGTWNVIMSARNVARQARYRRGAVIRNSYATIKASDDEERAE